MTAEKIVEVANYIAETGCTVRQAAKKLQVSKSTIHQNMTQDLKSIDSVLYFKVKEVLNKNKTERHIRGGAATRERYLNMKKES